MNPPDKCPRCGVGKVGTEYNHAYQCGTMVSPTGRFYHTTTCHYFSEFRKPLDEERDALAARVRELEEKRSEVAARNLSNMLHVEGLHRKIERLIKAGDGLRAVVARDYPRTEFCDEWDQAKETKW